MANQGFGAFGGLYLRVWRNILWYHGRSMVVPYCYQCAPSAQPAILSIAIAYAARMFGVRWCYGQSALVAAWSASTFRKVIPRITPNTWKADREDVCFRSEERRVGK